MTNVRTVTSRGILRNHEEEIYRYGYLGVVIEHKKNSLMRKNANFQDDYNKLKPKEGSCKTKAVLKRRHYQSRMDKPHHGFLFKSRQKIKTADKKSSSIWLTISYYCAIQEEEISISVAQQRRCKDKNDCIHLLKYHMCHKDESMQHLLACCGRLISPMV